MNTLYIILLLVVATQAANTYINPVVHPKFDCPDPGSMYDEATDLYYTATTSQTAPDAYPIRVSKNLAEWEVKSSIFPADSHTRPNWTAGVDYWAPELHKIQNKYYAIYTTRDKTGLLCVGFAVSTGDALGPYVDHGAPLIRNASVGSIDAHLYYDAKSNSTYIIWKADGNANTPEEPTPIFIQNIDLENQRLIGQRSVLISNDLPWEGNLVEGPWMLYRDAYYYLFYSANAFYDDRYAVGVARAVSPRGPFVKHGAPILVTNSKWSGPGHCSVITTRAGNTVMVYHSWQNPNVYNNRVLAIDEVKWGNDGWPFIATSSPSIGPQPIPL